MGGLLGMRWEMCFGDWFVAFVSVVGENCMPECSVGYLFWRVTKKASECEGVSVSNGGNVLSQEEADLSSGRKCLLKLVPEDQNVEGYP